MLRAINVLILISLHFFVWKFVPAFLPFQRSKKVKIAVYRYFDPFSGVYEILRVFLSVTPLGGGGGGGGGRKKKV